MQKEESAWVGLVGDSNPKTFKINLQGYKVKEPLPKTKNMNTILFHEHNLFTTLKDFGHHRKQ